MLRILVRRRTVICALTASASALLVCAEAAAAGPASKPNVVVTVFADHYVVAGRVIDDLNVLETAVAASHPRAMRLNACGHSADHPQRAAAHRFRKLNLELRFLEPDAQPCTGAADARAMPARARHGQGPFGIDYEAVERWWHEFAP